MNNLSSESRLLIVRVCLRLVEKGIVVDEVDRWARAGEPDRYLQHALVAQLELQAFLARPFRRRRRYIEQEQADLLFTEYFNEIELLGGIDDEIQFAPLRIDTLRAQGMAVDRDAKF